MKSIKEVIMERDGISSALADEQIEEARAQFDEYLVEGDTESAEKVCMEFFSTRR